VRHDGRLVVKDAVIRLVESAYALELADAAWLGAVNDAARPLLDDGLGISTYTHRFHSDGTLTLTGFVGAGLAAGLEELVKNWLSFTDAAALRALHVHYGAAGSTSEASGGALTAPGSPFAEAFGPFGIRDVIGARGLNGGSCVAVAAPRAHLTRGDVRFRATWERVAAHLGAGLRLRESLAGAVPLEALGDDDAVLEPDGRVEHAAGAAKSRSARDRLRDAAIRMDRARGRSRDDANVALDLWRALVDGRWSLIDSFDSDGRRFLVARRNDEPHADPRGLSPRESQVVALAALGHSNRLIAYHLGIGKSTVGTHLASAMTKLGVSSRIELVRMFSGG